ncbi:LysR family transcriptional regulator [Aeromicrobium alkaliterrae]|uniref:LysR family transcriptional regulator n=1 Tax=Aeromicrobium alkaliterrae TaxID=302168 RepID=A0ABP4W6Z2_9ACTN
MLDARKLRMLAELDDLGTIAAVAERLQQTAPGISMQLSALERDVGMKLTEKHGRTVRLTPAGRLLARHGRDLVEQLVLAEMEARSLREGAAGTYRVAAFPTAARHLVAGVWARLLDDTEHGLRIELLELEVEDAVPALRRGDVDLAVAHTYSTMEPTDPRGLALQPLMAEPVHLAVPDASDLSGPVDLSALATESWLVPHRERSCHDMVRRACGAAGFVPRIVAEATDFSVLLQLVAVGAGLALVPQLAATPLPAGVRLLPLSIPVERRVYLATRESSAADAGLRRIAELFLDAAELPGVSLSAEGERQG